MSFKIRVSNDGNNYTPWSNLMAEAFLLSFYCLVSFFICILFLFGLFFLVLSLIEFLISTSYRLCVCYFIVSRFLSFSLSRFLLFSLSLYPRFPSPPSVFLLLFLFPPTYFSIYFPPFLSLFVSCFFMNSSLSSLFSLLDLSIFLSFWSIFPIFEPTPIPLYLLTFSSNSHRFSLFLSTLCLSLFLYSLPPSHIPHPFRSFYHHTPPLLQTPFHTSLSISHWLFYFLYLSSSLSLSWPLVFIFSLFFALLSLLLVRSIFLTFWSLYLPFLWVYSRTSLSIFLFFIYLPAFLFLSSHYF